MKYRLEIRRRARRAKPSTPLLVDGCDCCESPEDRPVVRALGRAMPGVLPRPSDMGSIGRAIPNVKTFGIDPEFGELVHYIF
jgi:hypothetical protein